jgi:hypothetical protein
VTERPNQRPFTVYVAAPRSEAHRADLVAGLFRDEGFEVSSKWHESGDPIVDPSDHLIRSNILFSNTVDLMNADVVVALMDLGEPKATYCEIGYALACDKHVIWVNGIGLLNPRACIYDSHPRVFVVEGPVNALLEVKSRSERIGKSLDDYRQSEAIRASANLLRALVAGRLTEVRGKLGDSTMEEQVGALAFVSAQYASALNADKNNEMAPLAIVERMVDIVACAVLTDDIVRNAVKDGSIQKYINTKLVDPRTLN